MQGTSANYNPYVDEIKTDALIEFELIDVDAAQTATSTVNVEKMSFSNLQQTHDRITQNSMKLATLDDDLWKLDGSFSLPMRNGDNLETGYFSSVLSDAGGNIDVAISFTFTEPQSSDGFTVIFDTKAEEVASDFTITAYAGRYTTYDKKTYQPPAYDERWVIDGVNVSRVFDPIYYADNHADLYAAFGHNEQALFNHFRDNGINENRRSSQCFDVNAYRDLNTDLSFSTRKEYYMHYLLYGQYEQFPFDSKTTVGNADVVCYVDMRVENYTKIAITFTKTAKPYRRIRLTELVFGHLQQFKGNKIQNLRVRYEAGLYMEKMPANTLQFTIDNSDRAYNVLNPTGIYRFLQEGQGINCSITINGESVSMGRFFFETATANDDGLTATVTAYDLLWRLDKGQYNSGRTGTWTVLEAIQDVVADSGVEMTLNIDSNIGSRVIRRCIPEKTTHREALRMIAQAGRCVLYFNRIGELKAKEYNWNTAVDHLTPRNMRGWGEATDRGLVNNVIVEASDDFAKTKVLYTANDRQSGEPLQTMKVDNPLANGNEVAEWILMCCKHRNTYNTPAQSNPARDIGDCINISNVYGTNDNAVIILQDTNYTGYILDTVQAFGGGNA